MDVLDKYNIEKIWPDRHVQKVLGKGSFGEVYEVSRHDEGLTDFAAVKVICIPRDDAEIEAIRADGFDDVGIQTYLKGIVDDFIGEIKVMISLKGISNIVTVEDYRVVQREDGMGWLIYIRMELLTSFPVYMSKNEIGTAEVLKMAADICSALEMCSKCDIIHRDIKPENIFVNRFGIYKLGDFGIARKIDNISMGLSQKGTFNYMAPEVYTGNVYDQRVDIYSLGIVMYKLLNNGLFPFLSQNDALNHEARQNALDMRLRGTPLPPPSNAPSEVSKIILKACAFRCDGRYNNASEMKADILKALTAFSDSSACVHDKTDILPSNAYIPIESAPNKKEAKAEYDGTETVLLSPSGKSGKSGISRHYAPSSGDGYSNPPAASSSHEKAYTYGAHSPYSNSNKSASSTHFKEPDAGFFMSTPKIKTSEHNIPDSNVSSRSPHMVHSSDMPPSESHSPSIYESLSGHSNLSKKKSKTFKEPGKL